MRSIPSLLELLVPFAPWDVLLPNPAARAMERPDRPYTDAIDSSRRRSARVIWLGDSLIQWWQDEGRTSWDQRFADLPSLNFGVAGDRTEHLLWRIEHGELHDLDPELAVLLIGSNNVGRQTSGQIAAGIGACIRSIRARLPKCPVLLLGLLPIGPAWNRLTRAVIPAVNRRLAQLVAGERSVELVDPSRSFLGPDGEVRSDLLPNIHLSAAGYSVLAELVAPAIHARLGGRGSQPG